MNGCAELRAVDGGAGLEGEWENEAVERWRKGGVNVVEEREGLLMAGLVHVRGQLLR